MSGKVAIWQQVHKRETGLKSLLLAAILGTKIPKEQSLVHKTAISCATQSSTSIVRLKEAKNDSGLTSVQFYTLSYQNCTSQITECNEPKRSFSKFQSCSKFFFFFFENYFIVKNFTLLKF